MTNGTGPVEREPAERGARGRWWWWVLVGLIALVVIVLLARANGEEELPGAEAETPMLEPADPAEVGPAEGSVTFGGEDAEPIIEGGDLTAHVGEQVLGTLVLVDSIISEGVYWVGEGRSQFLLVEPEGEETALEPNDRVTFRGTLRELDDEVRNAVWGAEAERTLEGQGAYVDVEELAPERP